MRTYDFQPRLADTLSKSEHVMFFGVALGTLRYKTSKTNLMPDTCLCAFL